MDRRTLGSVLFATLVIVGIAVPAVALPTNADEPSSSSDLTETPTGEPSQPDSRVNARAGPQLSTVIAVSSEEVQTDFDNTAFERSAEGASEEARAELIAERADELRDRAESIRDDFDEATQAYEDGDLTRSEYAQRIAVLNARATNLRNSHEQLRQQADDVSPAELRAAGVSRSALDGSGGSLRSVTGTGAEALLGQFTGESDGKIELEVKDGLSIEIESEDGGQSREFEQPRDDTDAVTVSQPAALETARGALSSVGGRWVLTGSEADENDGAYEFAFALRNDANLTGRAEVAVDGSSGAIFALEEETEPRDDDGETADEGDDSDRELRIVVAEGTPGPNERITVQVLADGEPAADVPVYLNDRASGTTDSDGRVTVTLPAADEAELTAETDDAKAEIEFEFESEATEEGEEETESEATEEDEEETESEATEEDEEETESEATEEDEEETESDG